MKPITFFKAGQKLKKSRWLHVLNLSVRCQFWIISSSEITWWSRALRGHILLTRTCLYPFLRLTGQSNIVRAMRLGQADNIHTFFNFANPLSWRYRSFSFFNALQNLESGRLFIWNIINNNNTLETNLFSLSFMEYGKTLNISKFNISPRKVCLTKKQKQNF